MVFFGCWACFLFPLCRSTIKDLVTKCDTMLATHCWAGQQRLNASVREWSVKMAQVWSKIRRLEEQIQTLLSKHNHYTEYLDQVCNWVKFAHFFVQSTENMDKCDKKYPVVHIQSLFTFKVTCGCTCTWHCMCVCVYTCSSVTNITPAVGS